MFATVTLGLSEETDICYPRTEILYRDLYYPLAPYWQIWAPIGKSGPLLANLGPY